MLTSISRNFCKLKHMQAMDVPPLPPSVQNKIGQTLWVIKQFYFYGTNYELSYSEFSESLSASTSCSSWLTVPNTACKRGCGSVFNSF